MIIAIAVEKAKWKGDFKIWTPTISTLVCRSRTLWKINRDTKVWLVVSNIQRSENICRVTFSFQFTRMSLNLRMIARIRSCKAVVSTQPDRPSGTWLLFTIQPFLWSSREGDCFYTWPQGSSLYHKDFKPTRWWMQGRRLRDKMKNTRPYFMMKLSNVSNVSSLGVKLWPYTSSSLTKFDNSVDDASKKKSFRQLWTNHRVEYFIRVYRLGRYFVRRIHLEKIEGNNPRACEKFCVRVTMFHHGKTWMKKCKISLKKFVLLGYEIRIKIPFGNESVGCFQGIVVLACTLPNEIFLRGYKRF